MNNPENSHTTSPPVLFTHVINTTPPHQGRHFNFQSVLKSKNEVLKVNQIHGDNMIPETKQDAVKKALQTTFGVANTRISSN